MICEINSHIIICNVLIEKAHIIRMNIFTHFTNERNLIVEGNIIK